MYKISELIKTNFAYISISILLSVIAILLFNAVNINPFITFIIFLTLSLYFILFIKHEKLKNSIIDNSSLIDPIRSQYHLESSGCYAVIDQSFNITDFNELFLKEYSFDSKTLLGQNLFDILQTKPKYIVNEIDKNGNYTGVIESKKNGQKSFHSLIVQPTTNGPKKEFFVICNNVTDSLRSDQEIKEEFLVDKFTGLSTKSKLLDDLDQIDRPTFGSNTLIYITIDEFDEINEFFGIDAGNKVLLHVANWLKQELPTKKSKLYKLDLDSFAILITKRFSVLALDEYLKKISQDIEKENFFFKETALNISFTLGAARCKKDIVKCAYLALKDAKNLKKSYKIFDKNCQHEERFVKNIRMNQTIKDAITENRVVPFFQPIYNYKTDKVEKFESLIRIQNRNENYLNPTDFLDVAKKSKLYSALSKSMIKCSFEKLETSNFPITINISVDDILDKKVSSFILRKLNNTNLGHLITFEIVESEQIENYVKVINFIKKVKLLGCKVAIDDFGSGYSNFEQLLKLDIDYLKIDGSLIKDIITNKDSEIMIRSIVSFAKEMGIQTIAEFVSSREIFDKVKLMGIDYAQGYHIGKPSAYLGKL